MAQSHDRVPELVTIRHGRMAATPWTNYRGAVAVMAADLATAEHSGLEVQLCGDAHSLNFDPWATPERNLSHDLRDFHETLPGPFDRDRQRLAASLEVMAREVGRSNHAGAARGGHRDPPSGRGRDCVDAVSPARLEPPCGSHVGVTKRPRQPAVVDGAGRREARPGFTVFGIVHSPFSGRGATDRHDRPAARRPVPTTHSTAKDILPPSEATGVRLCWESDALALRLSLCC